MNHPLIVITNVRPIEGDREPETSIKALAASLGRSDCGFPILLLRNEETPLFRIRRAGLTEVSVSTSNRHLSETDPTDATRKAVLRLSECVNTKEHPWIIVMDQAGIALRNIEHLIPEDTMGPFAGKQADFYWAEEQGRPDQATTGIWAVRGHLLETVLPNGGRLWQKSRTPLTHGRKRSVVCRCGRSVSKRVKWPRRTSTRWIGTRSRTRHSSPCHIGRRTRGGSSCNRCISERGSGTPPD